MTNDFMEQANDKSPLTLLGLGAMGTALARTWLAAGYPLTVWNRTAARAEALAPEGAKVAASAAEAVAASELVVLCLLDDASIDATLDGVDLTGKDLVNLTTSTPEQGRARAEWARERGARFVDAGIMAVPPMIGVPEAGGYIFYSGSLELFDAHQEVLAVPVGTKYVGEDAGFAALYDVALLSSMYGMFGGITHALALIGKEDIAAKDLAPLLADWLNAMSSSVHLFAEQFDSGDQEGDSASNLAMQVAGIPTFRDTAAGQGISTELLDPYFDLMKRQLAQSRDANSTGGTVDLLRTR
jgi:3-hydroxyisobutyrate dehydrogenase-like beta-hydroxyacid dehydrogenase